MNFLIPSAHAQAAGQQPAGGELFQILFLVGLFVLFYFIAIRPQRKRQKEHAEMVAALEAAPAWSNGAVDSLGT